MQQFTPTPPGWVVLVECRDRECRTDRRAFRSPVVGWAVVATLYSDGRRFRELEPVWLDHTSQPVTRPEYARLHDTEAVAVFLEPPPDAAAGVPPVDDPRLRRAREEVLAG